MIVLIFLLSFLITGEASPVSTEKIFEYINEHQDDFIKRFEDWVAIESDSSDPLKRQELIQMMHTAGERIKQLGGTVELIELGDQQLPNGNTTQLPPVILGEIGKDPQKPTVCFYGHLDVQPAKLEDGWSTEPYVLTEKDGNLYGRGTSDDKGQILAVLNAIEALQQNELPVNVKLLLEGMEEVGSNGLFELVEQINSTFFSDVSYIVVTDTAWLSNTPGITYGSRGNCYFFLEVEGAKQDLHSGSFGGVVFEAMNDLIFLLSTLVDSSSRILIPGIYDAVPGLTVKEQEVYERTGFDFEKIKAKLGIKNFTYTTKKDILIGRSRLPSLSIHGIEGAFSATGTKTVIPSRVIGKFSIRLVPNMEPAVVFKQVTDYLNKKFAERKSPNHINITTVIAAKPWLSDTDGAVYLAARRAIKKGLVVSQQQITELKCTGMPHSPLIWYPRVQLSTDTMNIGTTIKKIGEHSTNHFILLLTFAFFLVFQTEADLIRAGGTIPIASHFQDVTGKSTILLGIGGPDDAPHGQNEKISRYNFIEGTKLYATFLQELV